MGRKVYKHSFAGGQVSPLMLGHIEDEGYQTGYADGLNMLVLPTGALTKRPQFDFVKTAKSTGVRMFPFVYGDGDAYAMEWGPNHVRFHANGATLKYATPIPVASVDLGTDTFTTTAAHGLAVNNPVRITHKGTSIPGNLATGTVYYVRTVPSTTTFTLSASAGPGALLDLTTHSTIDETSFWLQSALPREYVQARNVTRSGNNLDAAFAHSLVTQDLVHFTTSGTLPAPLVAGTVYAVVSVDADSFRVATNATAAGTAAFTFTASASTNVLTAVAHGLPSGTSVAVSTSGTLPSPLISPTNYFVINVTDDTFQLAATAGGAPIDILTAGVGTQTVTPYIELSTAGSGTHTFHYAYESGDIVWGGSLTLLGTTSSRAFWCVTGLSTALPTVADWHQMPADGTYELYHALGAAALAELNYDQSFDVWTHCQPQSAATTLSRESVTAPSGISATTTAIRWVFAPLNTASPMEAPSISLSATNYGEYYGVQVAAGVGLFTPSSGSSTIGVIAGDVVYLEGSIGSANAITDVAGTPGFFLVNRSGTSGGLAAGEFTLRAILSGATDVVNSGGSLRGGYLRVVGSSSRLFEAYRVTALADGEESETSDFLTITNNLDVPGSSNVIVWTAVDGAQRYRLYKKIDEVYGLVGETDQLTFTDNGIGPDLSIQPPTYDDDLTTEFPRAVAWFQQRQYFGGTDEHQRRIWGSKTGTVSTMSYHERLLLDTDRIKIDVAARERTLVRHLVPMTHLIAMTSAAEIRLSGVNSDVMTPTSVDARPLSQVGCTGVRPIVVNSNLLFVGEADQHVYEMQPQQSVVQPPVDLSVRCANLFDDYALEQSAQQKATVPIEWYVRDDGSLLGMTYLPEQNIRGWHLHAAAGTSASIDSVCVIPDSDGHRLYAAITRTINAVSTTHIERMGRIEQPDSIEDCRFLDSCITYSGAGSTIPVAHLPGEVVYAVVDGRLQGPFPVTAGNITLTKAATATTHVGLLPDASLRLLPVTMMVDGYGKGRELSVNSATVRVDGSCSFDTKLYDERDEELNITRTAWPAEGLDNFRLRSRDAKVSTEGGWNPNAQIVIEQSSPFPLTIVSVTVDVDVGGPQ